MSEVKANKISPATSTVVTLGDSSDTFVVTTGAKIDLNGTELILDANANTSITADTDDQIDIKIAGADDFRFTANNFNVLSGSTLTIDSGATVTNSGTATGFVGTKLEASSDTSAGDNAAIGYTAGEGLILTGQGSTDDITIKNDADTTVLNVATGGTNVEVSAGNILFGTADKGVYLGVTSATAANLLDDYEEGTYNPTVTASTSGGWNLASGYDTYSYTKVGRLVMVSGYIDVTSDNSPDGAVQVSLPFTPSALSESSDQFHSWSIILTLHADAATNAQISCWTTSGIGNSRLYEQVHGTGAGSYLIETEVDTVFGISINLWYLT